MEIGGQDITIKHAEQDPLTIIGELIYKIWPDAILELSFLDGKEEIFLYENREAADSWEVSGRTDDNDDQMIWITFEPGQLHCVLKEGKSKTFNVVEKIGRAVNGTLHHC